jgi:N-acetylglutamate synthase-like GNAT family acetyltransferase
VPTVQPNPVACLRGQRAVRIRPATAIDWPRITALLSMLSRSAGDQELFRTATATGGHALVAETVDGAHVVGCAAHRPLYYGRRAEAGYAVRGDYWTSGLARALLVQLARTAAGHGIPELIVKLHRNDRHLVDGLWDEFGIREAVTAAPGYAELVLRHGDGDRAVETTDTVAWAAPM